MDKHYYKVEDDICVERCYKVTHIPQGTPVGAWFCFCCGFRIDSGKDKKGNYIICKKWQKKQ